MERYSVLLCLFLKGTEKCSISQATSAGLSSIVHSKQTSLTDEKAMNRNRYNRIPHTSPDTTGEWNTTNQDGIKKIQHKWKAKRSALSQPMNHSRSTALEQSVTIYWAGAGRCLNRFHAAETLALDSTVVQKHTICLVRVKDSYSSMHK